MMEPKLFAHVKSIYYAAYGFIKETPFDEADNHFLVPEDEITDELINQRLEYSIRFFLELNCENANSDIKFLYNYFGIISIICELLIRHDILDNITQSFDFMNFGKLIIGVFQKLNMLSSDRKVYVISLQYMTLLRKIICSQKIVEFTEIEKEILNRVIELKDYDLLLMNITINIKYGTDFENSELCNETISYFVNNLSKEDFWDINKFEIFTDFVFVCNDSDVISQYISKFTDTNVNDFLNIYLNENYERNGEFCLDLFSAMHEFVDQHIIDSELEDIDEYIDSCNICKKIITKNDIKKDLFSFEDLVDNIDSKLKAMLESDENNLGFVISFLTSLFIYQNTLINGFGDIIINIIENVAIDKCDNEIICDLIDFFNAVLFNDDGSYNESGLSAPICQYLLSCNLESLLCGNDEMADCLVLQSFSNLFINIVLSKLALNEDFKEFIRKALEGLTMLLKNSEFTPIIAEPLIIVAKFFPLYVEREEEIVLNMCEYIQTNSEKFSKEIIILSFIISG